MIHQIKFTIQEKYSKQNRTIILQALNKYYIVRQSASQNCAKASMRLMFCFRIRFCFDESQNELIYSRMGSVYMCVCVRATSATSFASMSDAFQLQIEKHV